MAFDSESKVVRRVLRGAALLWYKKPSLKKYTREGSYHIFIFSVR
jgi:hypothetical protein